MKNLPLFFAALCVILLFSQATVNDKPMKQVIKTENAPAPIGPYNQAILANGTLYMSGQIALDPETGELVTDNVESETGRVMANLQAVLQEAGMDFSNVVKTSIFLTDMNDFTKVNEVYGKSFGEDAPARETVQVARLPKDVKVEISMIAVKE